MGLFRQSSSSSPTQVTVYSGLQVQTQSGALPIPIVWGRNLVTPNCLWYSNFQAHPQRTGAGKGGGKGGGGGGNGVTGYTYTASLIMGLCEGPIAGVNRIWSGSSFTSLSGLNLSLFTGTTPQSLWGYFNSSDTAAALETVWESILSGSFSVVADYSAQALHYPGVAYVASTRYSLGSAATIGNNVFEISGILFGTGSNGVDADPASVIHDFLTNPQYGVGFPDSSIDSATLLGTSGTTYQAYTQGLHMGISPVLSNQETASSIISRWLQLTNSAAVWSGGLLRFIPFGDSAIGDFIPNTAAIYDLTDEDFVHTEGEDPVAVIRSDPHTTPNVQRLEILDRNNSYASTSVEARDQAAIERYGLRIGSTITAHELCDQAMAQMSAQLVLQRVLYVRNTYRFKLSWEFCLLDPMDIVTLTDTTLGLDRTPVRIIEIEEDEEGVLSLLAEEFPQGVGSGTRYPSLTVATFSPNGNTVPASVNSPFFLEPPSELTGGVSQFWIGASGAGGDPNWGGCNVWVSLDNISYSMIGTITSPVRQGFLTSSLGSFSGVNPDTSGTLAVDLTQSAGVLNSASVAGASAGATLCAVGPELLSYTTATLTAENKYTLTDLYRGLFSTTADVRPAGTSFTYLDSAIFKYDVPVSQIGKTVYIKLQSFNVFGRGLQDLSVCTAYFHPLAGSGGVGPVASLLSTGAAMDLGLVNQVVSQSDDYGAVVSDVYAIIDLGNVTS